MTTPLLLHIGYHKTATTWMQKQLFLPEHGYHQVSGHEEVSRYFTDIHGLQFDHEVPRDAILEASSEVPKGSTAVISSELLVGNPFFGGRESDVYAERLHQAFPDAYVLITIRAQDKVLRSIYMQYVSRGGTMPPELFFNMPKTASFPAFSATHFEYDWLIAHYRKLFGDDKVLVLPQEALQGNMDQSIQDLASFCANRNFKGISDAKKKVRMASYPEYAAPFLRRSNYFQKSVLDPNPLVSFGTTPGGLYKGVGFLLKGPFFKKAFDSYRPVSRYVATEFSGRFTESNQRLRELLGGELDLSKYP
ncbi:hypothetical protein [Maritimibacter dapengensis]|uniref:Sulfotransferase family protein n=1 Tax=Maritimibacter dapengensis TaxID=2836868 RepID=A0ABS6T3J3_9RHOB|nr:hypothetical protein [Maritimibacter dapengensis]MBV7379819.1 hypothetical protein [Maritimibacter dapengensis]